MAETKKSKPLNGIVCDNSTDAETMKSLVADLTCDDAMSCQRARRCLVAVGVNAVPSLIKALGSDKKWVRWEAAKALGQIGDSSATQALVDALEDKSFDVRWLAAEALVAIGRPAVVPLLKKLLKRPDSLFVRQGAHHVLHDMDRGDLDKVMQPVMAALEDIRPSVLIPPTVQIALHDMGVEH